MDMYIWEVNSGQKIFDKTYPIFDVESIGEVRRVPKRPPRGTMMAMP